MKQFESNGVKYAEMTVTYVVNEEQVERLKRILVFFRQYRLPDGSYPNENLSIDEVFKFIMQNGSSYEINQRISTALENLGSEAYY